jgi:hypothetical protein
MEYHILSHLDRLSLRSLATVSKWTNDAVNNHTLSGVAEDILASSYMCGLSVAVNWLSLFTERDKMNDGYIVFEN